MKKSKLIPWWKTNLGLRETKEINKAVLGQCITQGKITAQLENHFASILGTPYVLLTTNGSASLLAALIVCGIRANDEVIIPNLTFIATAQAPLLLGAKVKLIDSCPTSPLIDTKKIESQINSRTKVIIAVHLNGKAADIQGINKLAKKHNIKVIEDTAQALCSRNKLGLLGTQSDVGVFSLGVTKLVTTGHGGLLVTKDKKIFCKLKLMRDAGSLLQKNSILKTFPLGFNFKFNDILAAIGLGQLNCLKEKITIHKKIHNFYKNELKKIEYLRLININNKEGELPLWSEVLCAERRRVISLLRSKNIQAIPFDSTISNLLNLKNQKYLKFSKLYADYGLILPSGPGQKERDLEYVIRELSNIQGKLRISCKDKKNITNLANL